MRCKGKSFTGSDYFAAKRVPLCEGLDRVRTELVQLKLLKEEKRKKGVSLQQGAPGTYSVYALTDEGRSQVPSVVAKHFVSQEGKGFFLSLLEELNSMPQKDVVKMAHNKAWDMAQEKNRNIDFKDNDWV